MTGFLTRTHQPVRIKDLGSLADPNTVVDPQPFSRRFLGTIRSLPVSSAIKGHRLKSATLPLRELPEHETCVTRLKCN
ncbi:hypothetical protein E6H12_07670 [Candidatus Bathyarchaeota archaeon]|nr:MAG: hypothetical protein E6H12_07670 [Candidatus Bathyarchaeota archaeon]